MEDRSALFNQLKNFSQRKLKKVETKVVTASGEQLVEKRGAKGLQVLTGGQDGAKGDEAEPPRKLDLQVGLILPGFLIGSQDVGHDKSSLESYGVTHILNLDSGVENKFEDDYNYKNMNILDRNDFELDKILEDCFDFIDDGRHYGNVLIHCSGTIGLSRSTAICIAYLMNKEKQKFDEAFNNVKEARSFVKPNDGFIKQLKDYEVKLRGAQQVKESGIDDPFALRKKQEIEQEKAMVAGAASVKNRMKMFGATLDPKSPPQSGSRAQSVSPAPPTPSPSRWGAGSRADQQPEAKQPISKSMTPEPRAWQKPTSQAPPPPPPMPTKSLLGNDDHSARKPSASIPPPPPPPPPPGDLLSDKRPPKQPAASSSEQQQSNERRVFGRVPPPPMKIKGGLSIERQDSQLDRSTDSTGDKPLQAPTQSSLKLPLKKQLTTESGSDASGQDVTRAPSPSAALRAAKQQVAAAGSNKSSAESKPTDQARPSVSGQLNRSSTKKLLNLIKTKTRTDLTLPDGDENDEIEALLGALESESIENIDWDELGLDEDEVKGIIEQAAGDNDPLSAEEESSSSSDEDDDEELDDEEDEEVEKTTHHYVIRGK